MKELTGGGVDYSFEAIGLKIAAEQAFGMLRNGGTATVIGMIPLGQKIELPGVDFLREKKIQGSSMGSNRFRTDMPRYVDMYLNGKLNLDDMVSQRIKLDDVNEAFAALEKGEVARQVIMMSRAASAQRADGVPLLVDDLPAPRRRRSTRRRSRSSTASCASRTASSRRA